MVAGYAAKQLVEDGLEPGEMGIVSADFRSRFGPGALQAESR